MLSLILVQVPHFQSWKWLIKCFLDCKWVSGVPKPSWTDSNKTATIIFQYVMCTEQFLSCLVIFNPQNNLEDRQFSPSLAFFKADLMEFEPWSIWLQSPFTFFLLHLQRIKMLLSSSPQISQSPLQGNSSEHQTTARSKTLCQDNGPGNKSCKGLTLPS